MIRVKKANRQEAPRELIEQSYWLSSEAKRLHDLIRNMPATDTWPMIQDSLKAIKKYVNNTEQLIQTHHHSAPIPDWMKSNLGNNVDEIG